MTDETDQFELAMEQIGIHASNPKDRKSRDAARTANRTRQEEHAQAEDAEFEAAMAALDQGQDRSPPRPSGPPPRGENTDGSAAETEFLDAMNAVNAVEDKDAPPLPPEETADKSPVWETLPRRRSVPIDDILDLHGATVDEAIARLEPFIRDAFRSRLRRVGLVTGKGTHSPKHKSVLRPEVENWLFAAGARYITAVAEAPRAQGGRGMLVVTLRIRASSPD